MPSVPIQSPPMLARARWTALLGVSMLGCSGGNAASAVRPETPHIGETDPGKCEASKTHLRPLLVETPSGDRGELEALASSQTVVVSYHGCDLEVLRGCRAPGQYAYVAITPKEDRVAMHDADELYADVPLGVANLSGKLETSGELELSMTTVGLYQSDRTRVRADELAGDCSRATHVVTALTVGAFELGTGTRSSAGAGAGAFGAQAGGKSESKRRSLSRDGDLAECASSPDHPDGPPPKCAALLRVELLPVGKARPTCRDDQRWNGEACEALPVPIRISEGKRDALRSACKLGVKAACKAAEIIGPK
jgi:hypothetical protein